MDKEFINNVKKNGLLKEVSEAFKEYPPEEEWHKGDINCYICERMTNFGYDIGDIVYVPQFKYSNNNSGVNHLFVIIDKDKQIVPLEYFGLLISSNLRKLKYSQNISLLPDNKNNLNKESIVKTDYIYRLDKEMIAYKIGEVSIEKINYYKECVKNNFIENRDKDEYINEEQNIIDIEFSLLEEISNLRKGQKISQRELANIIGMKQPTLAKIEKGKNSPQLNTLLNILDGLGYTIKYEKKQS